jgi:hypothetical protein
MNSTEPMDNVTTVCSQHATPGRFRDQEPSWFLGKLCKISFPFNGLNRELMWVRADEVFSQNCETVKGR